LSSCLGGANAPHRAPVIHYGEGKGAGSAGIHTIVEGENIWRISKNYTIPMQEIILRNKLSAPYMLKVGQRLDMPPPRQYTVQPGDTVYEIARLFAVSMNRLVHENKLNAPYTIRAGQVLSLPTSYDLEKIENAPEPRGEQFAHVRVPVSRPADGTVSAMGKPVSRASKKTGGSKYIKTQIPQRAGKDFSWPVRGKLVSSYGGKRDGLYNDGINISVPRGTKVQAAENGVVVYAGDEISGYGNLLLVKHLDGWVSAYAHLDRITAARGSAVRKGQAIGTVGATGNVETPQLHFELRKGAQTKNPIQFLQKS
jgi:murein DD-endopeptidase MepM/ murein hydrolase activator NlpD